MPHTSKTAAIIEQRLTAIRQEMAKADLDAFIIPRADEYLGEYVPEHNERLRWCSGFTGSAGTVVVLKDRAALFIDGRYTIQARQQASEQLFEYHHLIETPHVAWIAEQLDNGAKVGYDAKLHSLSWQQSSNATLAEQNIELVAVTQNPVDISWTDRPAATAKPGMLLDEKYTGLSSLEKRRQIGAEIARQGADAAVITALDSIAWLLNIRGFDIECFCVILGSAVLNKDGSMIFFTNPAKIPASFAEHVGEGVAIVAEEEATATYRSLGEKGLKVLADPDTANAFCQLTVQQAGGELIPGADPVALPKACKNSTELEGMRQAHIRDAVSEVRFLAWLEAEVKAGNLHTEDVLSDKLHSLRAENENFVELSFNTISAAGANAAMCHYNHTNGTPAPLSMDNMYLVDSGAQYLDGTTDITRTVAIGNASNEQKKMFTLVMKGHITLDQMKFPAGTNGGQLDSLARQFLWQQGYDFDHGTGHGVGCFLNVHEGPQRIAKNSIGVALAPGMVISNEPGYYRQDEFGIRCENLIYVVDKGQGHDGKTFYEFDSLTVVPFDRNLIDRSLLSDHEINWINDYHARVRRTLSPLLTTGDLDWLNQATAEI